MEQTLLFRIDRIRQKKIYRIITDILFPAVLVAFVLMKVNQGLDITDSSYSPSNFLFVKRMDGMWFYSTFYANLLGALLCKLPFGETLLALNIYSGVIKVALALVSYYFFTKTVKVEKELAFWGVLVSVALCWCPTTILYNYLTYLLFFLGAMFLYKGLTEENTTKLVLAGFFLGTNFFVRLPNICEAALVIVVWFYSFQKKESFRESLKKTMWCMAGYFGAFIPGAILILFSGGFGRYFAGIKALFEMSSDTEGYSAFGMVFQIVKAYVATWPWIEIAIFMMLLAMLVFLVLETKLCWLRYVVTTFTSLGFILLMYKKGLFTRHYYDYSSIYRFGALVLSVIIAWMIGKLLLKKSEDNEKLLALITLIIIAVTPLGSNNDLYSNYNFMFFVLPVFLFFIFRFIKTNEHFRGVRYSVIILLAVYSFQCICFGGSFVFRDGIDGNPRDTLVDGIKAARGMYTTSENAKEMEGLADAYIQAQEGNKDLLLYGYVSGLGYYLNTPIAIGTAWPSLDSYSTDKFRTDIVELSGFITEKGKEKPIVIIGKEEEWGVIHTPNNEKQEILKDFLNKMNYSIIYDCNSFVVLNAD